ncbi:MAG: hypothetical protein HY908_06310 [Myxococcales bacterium]|nr:hypothetical protein [Myxococcales bacterium]
MQKEITVAEFARELVARIDGTKGIDCCKDEIKKLALMAKDQMGDKKIVVNWKEA